MSNEPSWTTEYQPDDLTGGQASEGVCLGAGDHSLFDKPDDNYIYLFYPQSDLYREHE